MSWNVPAGSSPPVDTASNHRRCRRAGTGARATVVLVGLGIDTRAVAHDLGAGARVGADAVRAEAAQALAVAAARDAVDLHAAAVQQEAMAGVEGDRPDAQRAGA